MDWFYWLKLKFWRNGSGVDVVGCDRSEGGRCCSTHNTNEFKSEIKGPMRRHLCRRYKAPDGQLRRVRTEDHHSSSRWSILTTDNGRGTLSKPALLPDCPEEYKDMETKLVMSPTSPTSSEDPENENETEMSKRLSSHSNRSQDGQKMENPCLNARVSRLGIFN